MIRISDSNHFDLNQAHAWGGLACGYQREPSEDKGREPKVEGELPVTGGLDLMVFKVPSSPTIPCFKVPPHSLGPKCWNYRGRIPFIHPLQPSAPFWQDPYEFGGLWQVRWGWVPFWGGLNPSVMETEGSRPLPLCFVSLPLCRHIPTAFCPPCLLLEGFTHSAQGLGFSCVPHGVHGTGTDVHELPESLSH